MYMINDINFIVSRTNYIFLILNETFNLKQSSHINTFAGEPGLR